eukprot:TRINITY_DN93198_c0_g1_i1.p2 TRINITY_DN93198_c0_g1~~TRINITY_DN93198_c0_g1_i1.p2  ORF type:complete len:316 (+),score=62.45 TRINITY_DN93198_c0_g1_i1:244-1191(+)
MSVATMSMSMSLKSSSELPMNMMDRNYLAGVAFMAPPGLSPPGLSLRAPPGLTRPSEKNHSETKPQRPRRLDLSKIEGFSTASTRSENSNELSPLSLCDSASASWTPRVQYTPDQTVIIFDWDDTLCPTSVCAQGLDDVDMEFDRAALSQLAKEAAEALRQAAQVADKVVIVTNAGEGWVEWSCAEWLPELLPALENVEVVSARSMWEPQGVTSPTEWKERTFEQVVDTFFARQPFQNIKNIVCVGDAPYEHEALARVVFKEQSQGNWCRSKSVKFMIQPSVESLTNELQMLQANLEDVVAQDEDLYLNYQSESL